MLADVAARAGVDVELGCNQVREGSCCARGGPGGGPSPTRRLSRSCPTSTRVRAAAQGNCGVCEMELQKFSYSEQEARLVGSGPQVVRTCVARVPGGGFPLVELQPLADDLAWGVDGFDT